MPAGRKSQLQPRHLRAGSLDDEPTHGEWRRLRVDLQNESTADFTVTAPPLAPEPQRLFPGVKNVPNWKDVNPRISAASTIFGTGKTALKASASRGVEQDSIRYAVPTTRRTHSSPR